MTEQWPQTDGIVLVIVNTVERAIGVFDRLGNRKESRSLAGSLCLIHSRFRPHERIAWREVLDRRNLEPRVIVSTQVVEAGVDLSACVLFTELAPWPSLVQRFGRCARYVDSSGVAETGQVFWMDVHKSPAPYEADELEAARDAIRELTEIGDGVRDAGLGSLAALQARRDEAKRCELFHRGILLLQPAEAQRLMREERRKLFPYDPRFVPRDKDLFDLFDTTPDLTGADIDIARFIRDGVELDVQVFWQDVHGAKPWKKLRPCRQELCPVPFVRFRDFLKKHPAGRRIWRWNYVLGDWERVTRDRAEVVFPGQVFLLETACGGYDTALGWTGDPSDLHFEPVRVPLPDADDRAPADGRHAGARSEKIFAVSDQTCHAPDETLGW